MLKSRGKKAGRGETKGRMEKDQYLRIGGGWGGGGNPGGVLSERVGSVRLHQGLKGKAREGVNG